MQALQAAPPPPPGRPAPGGLPAPCYRAAAILSQLLLRNAAAKQRALSLLATTGAISGAGSDALFPRLGRLLADAAGQVGSGTVAYYCRREWL